MESHGKQWEKKGKRRDSGRRGGRRGEENRNHLKKMKIKMSKVWGHFKEDGEAHARCTHKDVEGKVCNTKVGCAGGSTSTMWKHLEGHSIYKTVKKSGKITNYLPSNEEKYDFSIEKYIAGTGKAPNEVDEPLFKELVKNLTKGYEPKTGQTVSNQLIVHYKNIKQDVMNVIPHEGKKDWGLQFDEVTSVLQQLEYLGITFTCIVDGVLRLFKAGMFKIDKADSETISATILKNATLWGLSMDNCRGATGDGAAVVAAAVRLLVTVPGRAPINYIRCVAHFLNLSIVWALHYSLIHAKGGLVVRETGTGNSQIIVCLEKSEAKIAKIKRLSDFSRQQSWCKIQ